MTVYANTILNEREKTYGEYQETARISQDMKMLWRQEIGYGNLSPSQRESLDLIAMKIARILNGRPGHKDSWDDIAGYAELISAQLK